MGLSDSSESPESLVRQRRPRKPENILPPKPEFTIKNRIFSGSERIDFVVIPFFDGKNIIVTCSTDKYIRIFNEEYCEKSILHTSSLYSILFLKELNQIITSDERGFIVFWSFIPGFEGNGIEPIKEIQVSSGKCVLWELCLLSKNSFVCGVAESENEKEIGKIYLIEKHIKDEHKKENNNRKELELKETIFTVKKLFQQILIRTEKNQPILCIHKLLTEKDTFLFSGGDRFGKKGDYTIKKYNTKISRFDIWNTEHISSIQSISSVMKYRHSNNDHTSDEKEEESEEEEIVLSGSSEPNVGMSNISFHDLKGNYLKKLECFGSVTGFLFGGLNNNKGSIFIGCGGINRAEICYSNHSKKYFERCNSLHLFGIKNTYRKKKKNNGNIGVCRMRFLYDDDQKTIVVSHEDGEIIIFNVKYPGEEGYIIDSKKKK